MQLGTTGGVIIPTFSSAKGSGLWNYLFLISKGHTPTLALLTTGIEDHNLEDEPTPEAEKNSSNVKYVSVDKSVENLILNKKSSSTIQDIVSTEENQKDALKEVFSSSTNNQVSKSLENNKSIMKNSCSNQTLSLVKNNHSPTPASNKDNKIAVQIITVF